MKNKMNSIYLQKGKQRLLLAEMALNKGFLPGAVSNCYYAIFNLMQAVVGEPESGKWRHGGLPKHFCKICYKENVLPSEEIKGFIRFVEELYSLRVDADYYEEMFIGKDREVEYFFGEVRRFFNLIIGGDND